MCSNLRAIKGAIEGEDSRAEGGRSQRAWRAGFEDLAGP